MKKQNLVFLFMALVLFGCNTDGQKITAIPSSASSSSGSSGSSGSTSANLVVTWNAVTTNSDASPISDLAGYKVKYGTTSGVYTTTVDVGNTTTHSFVGMTSGTYYFVVTAYDYSGNESSPSSEVIKTVGN